jgi:glycosyltransferase involved in cell wall biosynthesis
VLDKITPVVLTLNEASNIARSLDKLRWATEVTVVDSGSTDGTAEIARAFPNVRFWTRRFDTLAQQWNAAVSDPGIRTEWVLALDADYMMTAGLVAEMQGLHPSESVSGYTARFAYAVKGTILRGSLYPPHVVLFRRSRGRYLQDGHAHRLVLDGGVQALEANIVHDDRKPMKRWIASQRTYARQEAQRLRAVPWSRSNRRDRVRKLLVVAPWAVPAYVLFGRGVLLDGLIGLRYAAERGLAELFIARAVLRGYLGPRNPA